jgi:hypothetical protein
MVKENVAQIDGKYQLGKLIRALRGVLQENAS